MNCRIELCKFDSILGHAARALRQAVFVEEQGVPSNIEIDDYDSAATHLVALDSDQVVATLRIVLLPDARAKIGRVAVAKSHRRRGIGRQLMLAAIDHLRGKVRQIVLTSQTPVIDFYANLGFFAEGPELLEANIPHRKMTLSFPAPNATPTIDAAFPGGNITVDALSGDTVFLRQDLRTTTPWWFYFHFRVANAAGRTIRFQFTNWDPFSALGPCCSDDSLTYRWLGAGALTNNGFSYTFPADARETFFAVSFPYVQNHLQHFLATRPRIAVETLARSSAGRAVELLRLPADSPKASLILTARQHCCEVMGSYVLEGVLDFCLTDPSPEAAFLRANVAILAVPFVDKDGVELGDQGKQRSPHDHNRDWSAAPLYPEVRALQSLFKSTSPKIVLDLHCPWIRSGRNEEIFFVESPEPRAAHLRAFSALVEKTQTGSLPYRAANNIPVGVEWNTYPPDTLHRWTEENIPGLELAVSIETPYALAGRKVVTPASARAFGADLARAAALYLRPRLP